MQIESLTGLNMYVLDCKYLPCCFGVACCMVLLGKRIRVPAALTRDSLMGSWRHHWQQQ